MMATAPTIDHRESRLQSTEYLEIAIVYSRTVVRLAHSDEMSAVVFTDRT
tara:strand:+ start:8387 stop:8536 length:150 start_codon:yes stop_codon:yes gene_type:complete